MRCYGVAAPRLILWGWGVFMEQEDTISAIATPSGAGGIGIVRLSGREAITAASRIFRPRRGGSLAEAAPYRAVYGDVVAADGAVVDEAIALVMRSPHSYTKEDVVELQCHGGSAVLRAVLSLTLKSGARLAEPGEFTKRAFLNGRIDLAQAQGVMDLISAKTEASRRQAMGHLGGHFSARIGAARERILQLIAHLEVTIDFPEEDIEAVALADAAAEVEDLAADLERILATAGAGRILREGLQTAIIGRPNVGKSSLLNALLREERAIVTDRPGTTRDSIEEYAEVGGVPLRLVDTAGIRETVDDVERIGISRSRRAAEQASLVLALFDGAAPLTTEDEEILRLAAAKEAILLLTKSDRPAVITVADLQERCPGRVVQPISVKTGDGLEALAAEIHRIAYGQELLQEEETFLATAREEECLRQALEQLAAAIQTADAGLGADFLVIDLRSAWEALGRIIGESVAEDVVEAIFSRFCLGK